MTEEEQEYFYFIFEDPSSTRASNTCEQTIIFHNFFEFVIYYHLRVRK